MFERSRLLLERYYCALLKGGMSRTAEHLLQECRGRLRGLQWLHARLVDIDQRLEGETRRQSGGEQVRGVVKLVFSDAVRPDCSTYRHALAPFEPSDELRVLLEAFCCSAHRIRDLLNDGRGQLPGLSRFHSVGVRNVRNHLVEHPSGPGGVLVPSIGARRPGRTTD
jgi:hypothetical protein